MRLQNNLLEDLWLCNKKVLGINIGGGRKTTLSMPAYRKKISRGW